MLYLTQRVETPAQATASVTLPIDVRVKAVLKSPSTMAVRRACCCRAVCCCAAAIFSVTKTAANSLK